MIWELQIIYEDVSMDAQYMDAVKREDMETAQRMVDAAAKRAGYDVGVAEHRTASDSLEGNKFDLNRAGSSGGGRIDFYKPAVYFAITSQKTRDILTSLEAKGFPPPYGGKIFRAFLKIEDGVDFDQTEKNGTRILGVTDPSRIKSADPVTYKNNKPIPLSERFNPNTDDIRY